MITINWIWVLYSVLALILYETETFLTEIVEIDLHFITFGKAFGPLLIGIFMLITHSKEFKIRNNPRGILLTIASGISNTLVVVFTVAGIVYSEKAYTSPGILISLQIISNLTAFILGRLIFKEKMK